MKLARKVGMGLSIAALGAFATYLIMLPHYRETEFVSDHSPASLPIERFPILPRFEVPRNYGFFIGDEIPLTLVIETDDDVVLDLVNLPQKGEKHGLFEVRDVSITSHTTSSGRTVYRAAYTLQYFGATPLTAPFKGLEILYADAADRTGPQPEYTYKSLITQPVLLNMSRIGPFRSTSPKPHKAPVEDRRIVTMALSGTVGVLCLAIALIGWYKEWQRYALHRREVETCALSPEAHTLQMLQDEGHALYPDNYEIFPLVPRLSHIIKDYVQTAYQLPAFSMTTAELSGQLHDQPYARDIMFLLEQCDALQYQPPDQQHDDGQQLWWETTAFYEKLQQVNTS